MIQDMIFDLDGTLVQAERLKAISYARTAVELCPSMPTEAQVVEAFKEVVGLSRQEVAAALMERFGLKDAARARMTEFGVSTPWQAFVQVRRVLEVLDLRNAFDFVASRDDVEQGEPDPEIYLLVSCELGIPAAQCLVIEDSPAGVKATLATEMWCIAVTAPFARQAVHSEQCLDERWIVDDSSTLTAVARRMAAEREPD